ncbi:unnamed protein product [Ixodes hexagonus]
MLRMEGALERHPPKLAAGEVFRPMLDMRQLFSSNVVIKGDVLWFVDVRESESGPGLYIGAEPASMECGYFEAELLDLGSGPGDLLLGFLSAADTRESGDRSDWESALSLGCRISQGRLWQGKGGVPGVVCSTGDRVGCGVHLGRGDGHCNWRTLVTLYVTHNGAEVARSTSLLSGRLQPALLLLGGQRVRILGQGPPSSCGVGPGLEDALMCVDSHEEDWLRLHDVRLNGPVLEYSGRGASMVDVGLAQTRCPLNTTSHYYELEILDPGEKCCIAIGLAHKDYPRHRHPGWNEGSIAYHADDGQIFVGSGEGSRFGPRCKKGDVMGCGILFPREYVAEEECGSEDRLLDNSPWSLGGPDDDSDNDDDDACHCWRALQDPFGQEPPSTVLVQVFFTHNGVNVGRREVALPRGGLYPTVGMLSRKERVKVDLHPLTG